MAKRRVIGEDGRVYVEKKRGGCLKYLGLAILVLIVLGVIGSMLDPETKNSSSTQTTTQQTKTVEPEIFVTATDVIQTFEQNELKGKETYTGKLAEISGTVDSIGESFGQSYITLKDESNEYSIISLQCMFEKENQQGLSDLNKGDQVTVIGTIGEQSINIEVKDCKLK